MENYNLKFEDGTYRLTLDLGLSPKHNYEIIVSQDRDTFSYIGNDCSGLFTVSAVNRNVSRFFELDDDKLVDFKKVLDKKICGGELDLEKLTILRNLEKGLVQEGRIVLN